MESVFTINAAREGQQRWSPWKSVSSVPFRASASRVGVRVCVPVKYISPFAPYAPTSPQPQSYIQYTRQRSGTSGCVAHWQHAGTLTISQSNAYIS